MSAPHGPQRAYTSTSGTSASGPCRLYFRQSGVEGGLPLVLIHGLSGSRRWWRYNLRALGAARQVYVVELAGFGAGYGPGHRRQRSVSVREAALLVAEWLDALNLRGVALIGHSMGGQIALRTAALRPERVTRLVLAASSGLLHSAWWRVAAQLPLAMRRGRLNFVPTILADGARAGLPNLIRSSRDLLQDDVTEILPQIVQPTLVIWGEHDVLLPPALGQAISAGIAGSKFVLLRGAGHVPMVDTPYDFNREVVAFLNEDAAQTEAAVAEVDAVQEDQQASEERPVPHGARHRAPS